MQWGYLRPSGACRAGVCHTRFMGTLFFTGKGDGGRSAFGSCSLSKSDPLFACLGDLDELNCHFGLCGVIAKKTKGVSTVPVDVSASLARMQELLFVAQAEVAFVAGSGGKETRVLPEHLHFLEELIQAIDRSLPALTHFIVPGGSELAASLDVARAVARRAERSLSAYPERTAFSQSLPAFVNRISSALFALARYVNTELHFDERRPSYR